MLFKDKLKEPVIYKGSNKAINELNQIQEYLKTHTSKELEDLFSMVLKEKRMFYLN
jgi:hypothetical protein